MEDLIEFLTSSKLLHEELHTKNNGMESQAAVDQILGRIHYKDRHILSDFDMGIPKTVLSKKHLKYN
jgi:hypothetical protein